MKQFVLLISCISYVLVNAQSFTAAGGPINDNQTESYFPLTATGIGNIDAQFGLSSVCININHTWTADLEISIQSPDGRRVLLSYQNGGSGDNYVSTCFLPTATTALENGINPFSGTFIPDDYLGNINNGQLADGTWNLVVKDINTGETGSVVNWSVNFSNDLPPPPPGCNTNNGVPANTCDQATPICSFYGFCSQTRQSYTADSWPALDAAFCGTVQNNAFIKFIASATAMDFRVWVTSSTNHDGIQLFFFSGNCGSTSVTDHGCYSPIRPGASPTIVAATGLTIGNTYYLMIDGFAGDECNYVIEPLPSSRGLKIFADTTTVCSGSPVRLYATGGNGQYVWTGPQLNVMSGDSVLASPTSSSFYSVSSIDPGGMCPTTKSILINTVPLPLPPTIPAQPSYCENQIAIPLTANGTNLLWYTTNVGGNAGTQPIIPTTNQPGLFSYYVSQSNSCESPRARIDILVNSSPRLGPDQSDTICLGKTANLLNIFNTRGLTSIWKYNSGFTTPPQAVELPGIYELQVENNNGCKDTAIVQLIIKESLNVFAGNDGNAVRLRPYQLNCIADAITYSWTPSNLLNNPLIKNPIAILNQDQTFIVKATDNAGCVGLDTVKIRVFDRPNYYIPNAFTPNSDGLNDVFKPVAVGIKRTDYFKVVNRYGKVVFETRDTSKGWNGNYLGIKQPAGTYMWMLKGLDENGKMLALKGTVLLIN